MLPEAHLAVLRVICQRLEGVPVAWAVTGSTALAAQGVAVEPHDVDLQSDAVGAYALAEALSECIVRPVAYSSAGRIRSHFGAALIAGVEVEIMGNVEVRRSDGSWRPPPNMDERVWVQASGIWLPVLSLEHEYEAYLLLGRTERAEAVWKHMEAARGPKSPQGGASRR